MAEYIGCRNCDSPDCKGCNIYTLAKMLNAGKFDFLMNGNRSINPFADVVEVRHGRWREECVVGFDKTFCTVFVCSACGKRYRTTGMNYCPNCGADMRGEEDE